MPDLVEGGAPAGHIDEPQGVPEASVDDKGRLKLPVDFVAYLKGFGSKKVFITTLDGRLGRMYPMSVWQKNQELLRNGPDRQAAQRISFTAKVNGDAVEIDDASRVLLPAALRKALGITGKDQLWLDAFDGCVKLVTKSLYEERQRDASAHSAADQNYLDGMGFK